MPGTPRRRQIRSVPARLVRTLIAGRSMDVNIRYVRAVRAREATGIVAAVYTQMQSEVGLLPPLTVYSPQPRLLAAAWAAARESWLATTLDRPVVEAIAAAVSRANDCPYCVDAHTMFLRGAGDAHTADRLRSHPAAQSDPGSGDDVVAWASATLTPGAEILSDPPFPQSHLPAATAVAVSFHMTNRVANVLLSDSAMPVPVPQGLGGTVNRIVAATLGRDLAQRTLAPGLALSLPPAADSTGDLPPDLAWSTPLPSVAAAYARIARVTDDLVRNAMSDAAIALVTRHVVAWKGVPPGLGKDWVHEATMDIDPSEAPAARLALLAALAAWQVDDTDIDDFRLAGGDDADLVTVVAWGALCAARRIGTWL